MFEAVFSETILQDGAGKVLEPSGSLVDAYYLNDESNQTTSPSSKGQDIGDGKHSSKEKEVVLWNKLVPCNMHLLMTNLYRFYSFALHFFFFIPLIISS